jgi:ABC-type phosphate transport system substrate-binding protein
MTTTIRAALTAAVLTACCGVASVHATEIVVVVNPKNPATRMFSEQAAQFFLGKSTLFTPIEFAEGSAVRSAFQTKVLGKDSSQVKAVWAKLVFTGKATPPKEFGSAAEVKKAVANDVNAIAYLEKSQVDDTVKVILAVP